MSSNTSMRPTHYGVNRWTVAIDSTPQEFGARYEKAVPPSPVDQVSALAARQAPWQEMIDLIDTAAKPFGFVIYQKSEFPLMRLAGDNAACTMYLIGNYINSTAATPRSAITHQRRAKSSTRIMSFSPSERKASGLRAAAG